MRLSKRYLLLGAASLFLTAAVAPAWGAAPSLKVEMHLEAATVYPYEHVVGVVVVSNLNNVEVSHSGRWDRGALVMFGITGSSGVQWEFFRPYRSGGSYRRARPPAPREKKFAPGASKAFPFTVASHRGKNIFERPGQVLLKGQVAGLETAPVTVTVQEIPKNERTALEWCRAHHYPLGWGLHAGAFLEPEELKLWEKFVTEHADTRYASLARLGFAGTYVRGIEGEKRPEKALALLEPLLASRDERIRQWAVYGAALAHQRLGHTKESEELASRLRREATAPCFRWLSDELTRKLGGLRHAQRGREETERAEARITPTDPSPKDRKAVLDVVERFRSSLEKNDLDGCLALLHPDFKYKDLMDRHRWKRRMEDEFEEEDLGGHALRFELRVLSVKSLGEDLMKVKAQEKISVRGKEETTDYLSDYRLRRTGGRWLISSYFPHYMTPGRADGGKVLEQLPSFVNKLHREGLPTEIWQEVAEELGFASPKDVRERQWSQLRWGEVVGRSSVTYGQDGFPTNAGRLTLKGVQDGREVTKLAEVRLKTTLRDGRLVITGYTAEERIPLEPGSIFIDPGPHEPARPVGRSSASLILVASLSGAALAALAFLIGLRLRRRRAR